MYFNILFSLFKTILFLSEGDIRQIGLYPSPSLYEMKLNGFIIIKKIAKNRVKHHFKKGDKLSFEYISVEEYKKIKNIHNFYSV